MARDPTAMTFVLSACSFGIILINPCARVEIQTNSTRQPKSYKFQDSTPIRLLLHPPYVQTVLTSPACCSLSTAPSFCANAARPRPPANARHPEPPTRPIPVHGRFLPQTVPVHGPVLPQTLGTDVRARPPANVRHPEPKPVPIPATSSREPSAPTAPHPYVTAFPPVPRPPSNARLPNRPHPRPRSPTRGLGTHSPPPANGSRPRQMLSTQFLLPSGIEGC